MRPLPDWMTKADFVILTFLDGHDIQEFENPPKAIARNTDISESWTRQRILILAEAGLVERTEDARGYYRLSVLGRGFLGGSLSENDREVIEAFTPETDDEADDNVI